MKRGCNVALLTVLVVGAALAVGIAGGVVLDRLVLSRFRPLPNVAAEAEQGFSLMAEAWNTIEQSYVDRPAVLSQTLTYGAIGGMVDALGDTGHSRFLSPEMRQQEQQQLEGSFEGIGAYVEMKDGQVVIVAPIDGSPAQAAGIRAGDIILRVGDKDLAGLTLDQAILLIRGPEGTEVTLTIRDPSTGETRQVTLTRARIKEVRVSWGRVPGTDLALLRIVSFSNGVTTDLQVALTQIQQQGLSGVVLDLRNNPGGLLSEAIGVASQFLAGGTVLQQKDANGQIRSEPVQEGGVAFDIPLVVLINQGSASAAEIVSGALQDSRRATLLGETTFGTGTVLSTIGLSDGSALLLATQEWLTPSGRVIWHRGIEPDVAVALPENGTIVSPAQVAEMTPAQLESSGDAQLLEAIRLLKEPTYSVETSAGSAQPATAGATDSAQAVFRGQTYTVTLADDGTTVEMSPGDRLALQLGTDYEWAVTLSDGQIVGRAAGGSAAEGAQGVYEALRSGKVTLSAAGDPPCRKVQPPCMAPSRLFTLGISVK